MPALTNGHLLWGQFPNDFSESITAKTTMFLRYRDSVVFCLQFNNDPTMFEEARGPHYGMVIRFTQDIESFTDTFEMDGLYMMPGAIGILHPRGTTPTLDDSAIFYAPLGETTQVSVWNYITLNFAGNYVSQSYTAVPAAVSNHKFPNTSQIVLAYNQYGRYYQKPYHVYTTWSWIGEVGGAAALLYFLQHGILWASIGCARRTCFRKQRAARKDAESDEEKASTSAADAKIAAQAAEEEADSAAVSAASASAAAASTTRPKRRKNRTPANNDANNDRYNDANNVDEVEMAEHPVSPKKTRKHQTVDSQGRVVIDMDSLAEDSEE